MAAPIIILHPPELEPPNSTELLPPPSDPMSVARVLLEELREDGETLMRRWRGGWWRYEGPHWAEAEDTAIRKWIYERLEHVQFNAFNPKTGQVELKPWRPNRSKVADLLDAMQSIVHLRETVNTPSWLDTGEPAGQYIACANGLLDVTDQTLWPATPRYFGLVSVPFDYDPAVGAPVEWLRFLNKLWPANKDGSSADEVRALQEWFGYVLSGRMDLQKILLLIGPTRSGKGTIARILSRLMGVGNVAAPTLASLGTNFGLQPLLGRSLAIVGDARLGRDGQHQVVERLLSISGEDMLTVDRKNREAWSGKIPARFMILSNELPRFGDASGAIANRFIVLTMEQSFLGREDPGLEDRIAVELPAILKWALAGLVRLQTQGRITVPARSKDTIDALADLVSPISAFVREACETGRDEDGSERAAVIADLYKQWSAWCTENGHHSSSVQKFSSDLRSVLPSLRVFKPHGERRSFGGIGISSEWLTRPREQHEGWRY